jgi:hypothetical protein
MPKKIFLQVLTLLCQIALATCLAPQVGAAATLKGNVNENDVQATPSKPAMTRNDITRSADPFAGAVQQDNPLNQVFDTPKMDIPMPPPQSKSFGLNAQDQGGAQPNFAPMQAQPAPVSQQEQMPQQQGRTQTDGDPNDPDSGSQALKLAWDQWHHNVAQAVYQRYTTYSNLAFSHSPPMSVTVSYTVSRDCQVSNIRLMQKSPNLMYNTLILTVVKSLNGDVGLLTFPQGSRRQSVEKAGTFSVNTGIEGFKYLTGDQETINKQNQRR